MPEGRWPRVTPCPKSGAAAESARLHRRRNDREELPKSEVRGGCQEQQTHARGQGLWLGGATPHLKPGAVAGRTNPRSKE